MEGGAGAEFLGTVEAETFQEACDKYAVENPDWASSYDSERLTHWGCRLFDNEMDARKAFG